MFFGAPYITATALAGTPLTMKAMPGPLPMPMSALSAVNACWSLASPAAAEASISSPCFAKMPASMPTSSGVKVQANATALTTRNFSAAPAGAATSTARQQTTARNSPRMASSSIARPRGVWPKSLQKTATYAMHHGRGALTRNSPPSKIIESLGSYASSGRTALHAHHRFAFPLVAPLDFREAVQAPGLPQGSRQQARRLRLHAPQHQRPASQLLGRVVRSRQAVRIHGQPRPPRRRGLLDRPVFGVVLRHAGRGRPRLRRHVERGDGRRAEEISGPPLGQRRSAAAGHQGCDRSGRRRGEPARPDGRQLARQRRRGCADRCRAAAAVLRALRQARPAAVPAPDRRDLPGYAVGWL